MDERDKKALTWWKVAKAGEDMPGEVWGRLLAKSYITLRHGDEDAGFVLTKNGRWALKRLEKKD